MNETKGELLKMAQAKERLAYYWQSQIANFPYLHRINFTPADAEYQSKLAAGFAAEYYGRAARLTF